MEYDVTIPTAGDGEGDQVSGVLSSDEVELLERFLRYADELLETQFCKEGAPSGFTVEWQSGSPVTITTRLPNWDIVMVFLHKLRPLVLNDEPTCFGRIRNLLAQHLDHPHLRYALGKVNEIYTGKAAQKRLRISSDLTIINSEKVLQTWLNSHEYHRDEEKHAELDELLGLLPLDAARVLFVGLLADKAWAIAQLANVAGSFWGSRRLSRSR